MDKETLYIHLKAAAVALAAQVLVGVAILILQAIGHLIPEVIQYLMTLGAGTASAAQVYKGNS